MYQINEDAYYNLRQLKNKVEFIRRINDAGCEQTQHAIVTSEQISTVFSEMEIQINEILQGIDINRQLTLIESSE